MKKKYYIYAIAGVIVLIIGTVGMYFLFHNDTKSSNQSNVAFTVTKTSKKSITFTVTNNYSQTIGIWPFTCASDTVELYTVKNDGSYTPTYKEPQIRCLLAPAPITVEAGKTYTGTYTPPANEAPIILSGKYVLKLVYGFPSDGFSLNNESSVYTPVFTIE